MKPITFSTIDSVICFFKKKYNLSETCDIEFKNGINFNDILGSYSTTESKITIYGLRFFSHNTTIKTLFHELIHYLQHKIWKTLRIIFEDRNDDFCQMFRSPNESLIKDYYHYYFKPQVAYKEINTTNIRYLNKPQEIEARKLSGELFREWKAENDLDK
jgi:hypothetical protein